jgi:hypothetical protein
MVTYVRTELNCGGLVVTKKQGRMLKSNQYGLCGTRNAVQVWGEHTQQRPQIPHKPLGETILYPKRRQKPRTCVGGSSRGLLIGLTDMIDNPDMTSSLGICGGKLDTLDDHKV